VLQNKGLVIDLSLFARDYIDFTNLAHGKCRGLIIKMDNMKYKKLFSGIILSGLISFICFETLAQESIKLQLNHSISAATDNHSQSPVKYIAGPETLRVLAVMVDFVEDSDGRTTGTGKFDLSDPDSIIDSPPHNKEYFGDHLLFLENYWRKVTNGKLIVKAEVLDSVFHLPDKMQLYSPPRSSTTFAEIGRLVNDTWRLVDSLNPELQFSNYHSFCIFHAGAGRDIDLVSVYGYDPTPYDLPSIYLGLNGLKNIFGSSYQGVPVDSGQFYIANSMVLPETENRKLQSIGGTSLLQLGINGLLVGSFGSYLGLPDLFDTKTGKSGIGRFGLMDGQSMFSWSGLFPPEPSAWEKYFLDKKFNLGMLHIIDLQPGETIANLPAVSLTDLDTIYRVPINAREYFLFENRNRDAHKNGSTITMQYNGQTIQKYFQRDTTRYNAFDQREIFGVVTDIDEFDWSLPGGVTKEGKFYDGGILIWHVDENVIDQNLVNNSVNANPNRKGVDLEEADGSQDIGQSYGFLSAGSGSEDGTSLDFWFDGNIAPVYKNEFGINTHPNSMSYDRANSHITIKDFTERSPRMSAKIILGDDVVKPLPGYPKFIGAKATNQAPQIIDGRIFISNGDSVFVFLPDGRSGTANSNGLFSPVGGNFPVATDFEKNFYGVKDSFLYTFKTTDSNNDSIYESVVLQNSRTFPSKITTSPVYFSKDTSAYIIIGCENGYIYDTLGNSFKIGNERVTSVAGRYFTFAETHLNNVNFGDQYLFLVGTSGDSVKLNREGKNSGLPHLSNHWEVVTALKRVQDLTSLQNLFFYGIADIGGNSIVIYNSDLSKYRHLDNLEGKISGIAVSNLNEDDKRDLIVTAGKKIYAFNQSGFLLDYFPISVSDTITNPPIIADVDGDGKLDILCSTKNNLIAAYSSTGKPINGFPISISSAPISTMSISKSGILTAMSGDGYLYAWSIPNTKSVTWGNYRGNPQHTACDDLSIHSQPISEFFPASRAYNWPNPVYNGKTNIRFYVSENSSVEIKIFDMAGDLVDQLNTNAAGGIDNEVEWNVSKIQSGVYYAHIKADGASQSATKIIKIAVVK
jgi:hypothetical protein